MATLTVPARRHVVAAHETPSAMADWATRTTRGLDETIPPRTIGAVGQVARVLVDNAQQHGEPPVTLEISVSTFVSVEVTDFGDGTPEAREDGTGSLAAIVGEFSTLWDITEREDGSKTVTAMIPIDDGPVVAALPRRRVR